MLICATGQINFWLSCRKLTYRMYCIERSLPSFGISGISVRPPPAAQRARFARSFSTRYRHTFLTRLGASGCDVWTLARIAGHSSLGMSYRYVHPSEDRVLDSMAVLGGHKTGHSEEQQAKQETQ